jgi:hypothetical protein
VITPPPPWPRRTSAYNLAYDLRAVGEAGLMPLWMSSRWALWFGWGTGTLSAIHMEAYAKASLKKYRPMAARNEGKKVFSGLL